MIATSRRWYHHVTHDAFAIALGMLACNPDVRTPSPATGGTSAGQIAAESLPSNYRTSSDPRIERGSDGPALLLPPKMQQALSTAVPGFRPWKWSEYLPAIREGEPVTERSAPFAAIADFNGDRRLDVVIAGNDSVLARVVAIVSDGDSVQVLRVRELPLAPVGQRRPRGDYLQAVPPGMIDADTLDETTLEPPREVRYERVSVRLEHDAFELVYWQKASSVFYWRNGSFVEWTTSD